MLETPRQAIPDAYEELWFLAFVGRAGAGRTDEQLLAVLELDVAAVGAVRAVLGLVTLDEDFRARKERRLGPAAAQQRVGSAGLDHPVRHAAVGVLDVEINPRVRIDPFHLRDGALQLDGLLRVKLRGEGMVREQRRGSGK